MYDLQTDVIKNSQEISHVKEVFAMALQRLEEKIDTGFDSVNDRLDKVEGRLDSLEKSLPERIDERMDENNKSRVFSVVKWIIITLGGSVTISIVTSMILKAL